MTDIEAQRERQNDWIKQKFKAWQLRWNDLFDQDAALKAAGEFERDDPLPDDIHVDYRLIFGLSHATAETRQACFALFPHGDEMHRRFDAYLGSQRPTLSEPQARALVNEIAQHIDSASPNERLDWTRISIVRREDRDPSHPAGRLDELFDGNLLQPEPEEEWPAIAARLFLTEPLYASAGNYYELRDWVTAAMFDPARDRIHALVYQLWHAGWQPLVSAEGVLLLRDGPA